MSVTETAWENLVAMCIENQKRREEKQPEMMIILDSDDELAIIDADIDFERIARKVERFCEQSRAIKKSMDVIVSEITKSTAQV